MLLRVLVVVEEKLKEHFPDGSTFEETDEGDISGKRLAVKRDNRNVIGLFRTWMYARYIEQ